MKVYCINLKRSTDRRAKMEAELAKTSLPYEFIDAVDGRLLNAEEKRRVYSLWRTRFRCGLGLTGGELGCALSHVLFFNRILESSDKVGVVLEDDVKLSPEFDSAAKEVEEFLLQTTEPTLVEFPGIPRDLPETSAQGGMIRVIGSMGTYAYAVNRAGAELLKKAFTPVCMPADFYRYLIRRFGLNYWVYPKMVVSVDMGGDSMVGDDRKHFTGWRLFLFRIWRCAGMLIDKVLSFSRLFSK